MKKILMSIVMILLATFCLVNVSALSGKNSNDGKITIKKAVTGQTYSIYQILKLDSYDTSKNVYLYKADNTSKWWNFLTTGEGKNYVVVDTTTYVVAWKENAVVADFAKKAMAFAKSNNITATKTSIASNETVTFSNLSLGYYLIDSSLGSLCNLTTTAKTVEVTEKNTAAGVLKEVLENSTNLYGSTNKSQMGDIVNFRTKINVKAGAENYKLYDLMGTGFTFNKDSIKIVLQRSGEKDKTLTKTTDYSIIDVSGYTFVIDFTDTFEETLKNNDLLVVTYSAILNENAVIGSTGNKNETYLKYGNNNKTNVSETKTYTSSFKLIKKDQNQQELDGASFALYDAKTNGNKINLVKVSSNLYRVALASEYQKNTFTSALIEAGSATIIGLDDDKAYYLEEVEPPLGFNPLVNRIKIRLSITIDNLGNSTSTLNGEDSLTVKYTNDTVTVINIQGNLLPSTGGIGTKIFTIIGSILILLSGLVLFTKFMIKKNNH